MRRVAILLLALSAGPFILAGQSLSSRPSPELPVINGLIRWWPNIFDARDEVTGQEGVVMGVLPPVATGADDPTEIGPTTAWVKAQPALTNSVFTIAFWVRCSSERVVPWAMLLGQDSEDRGWWLQTARGGFDFVVGGWEWDESNAAERVSLRADQWSHVAVARRPDGTSLIWVDGSRRVDGRISHAWPVDATWLALGGEPRGWDQSYLGGVRDVCAFDRVLEDREVGSLHGAGLPVRPVRNTAARLAATRQNVAVAQVTNWVAAPARSWTHRRFTTEDGLPDNIVKAVIQGRDGFLWVGTEHGLARFDGRQFRSFTALSTPALHAIGDTVWSLAEDRDGTLWAGIFGGLLRIRGMEFTAYTNGLPQRFVLQAEPAGDGSLWIAGFRNTLPRGYCWLRRYHPDTGRSSGEVIVSGHVRRLVPARDGVWFSTEQPQQISFWDGQSSSPVVVGAADHRRPGMELAGAAAPLADTELRVWTDGASPAGGWASARLGGGRPEFAWHWDSRLQRPMAARWTGPPSEDTWFGVSFGLARVRDGQLEEVRLGDDPRTFEFEISCMCANREGGVWFGTEEDGLHLVQERPIRTYTTQDGLWSNDVRSVCSGPGGRLAVGTMQGLNFWRQGIQRSPGTASLRSVTLDSTGEAWIGLAEFGRLALRRGNVEIGESFIELGLDWQDPNSLLCARDGTLWMACELGLTWLKPDRLARGTSGSWTADPAGPKTAFRRYAVGRELPAMVPVGLIEDSDGAIWLGSRAHGLFRVTAERVERFTESDGLAGDHCEPVYCDRSGALWIVGEGILTRRSGGRFQSAGERDGLPRDAFLDLIEDDFGSFWISGKRGIHRVAREEIERLFDGRSSRVRSLTLGVRDGLLTPECSSRQHPSMAKTPDGHIWVATRRGLATFDPRSVRLDTTPLPVVFERLVVNRRELPAPGTAGSPSTAELPPGSGQQIEIDFTATSLVAADRVRFRHRLDGYDADWSPGSDLRLAFYTNLRPGDYRFRVQSANAYGIWDERGADLRFVIRPHFWQTRAFYAGGVLLLLALGVGLHVRRLARQRRRQERRHEQALMDEKARIAADMHDELGAALTQIVILGEVGKSHAGDPGQARSALDGISQAAREMTSRISALVWATNPRHDTLESLLAYLREQAASDLENTSIRSRLEFPAAVPAIRVSAMFRRNLLLVLKEALTNLIRHSGANEVVIRLQVEGDILELTIQDDGCGFDPASRKGAGNGLANMEKRIRDLRGWFQVTSALGAGSRLGFGVPLSPSA